MSNKSQSELKSLLADNDRKIAQLQSLHQLAVRADNNVADYEGAQRRADEAIAPHGRLAAAPMLGEPITAYRRRMAGEVQKHSPKWKDFPLAGVRADAFESQIEAQIYADAAAAPPVVEPGTLRCIPKPSYGGHKICEYVSSPSAWMDQFAGPVRQYVRAFHDKQVA
jgi:hypothetical protein